MSAVESERFRWEPLEISRHLNADYLALYELHASWTYWTFRVLFHWLPEDWYESAEDWVVDTIGRWTQERMNRAEASIRDACCERLTA